MVILQFIALKVMLIKKFTMMVIKYQVKMKIQTNYQTLLVYHLIL